MEPYPHVCAESVPDGKQRAEACLALARLDPQEIAGIDAGGTPQRGPADPRVFTQPGDLAADRADEGTPGSGDAAFELGTT